MIPNTQLSSGIPLATPRHHYDTQGNTNNTPKEPQEPYVTPRKPLTYPKDTLCNTFNSRVVNLFYIYIISYIEVSVKQCE